MPKPRLTLVQAQLKGSVAHDPGRFADRKSNPKTTGSLGKPPGYFSHEECDVWFEIVHAVPYGVAGSADRMVCEMATKLLHQFRTDTAMTSAKMGLLIQLLSRLGLDPQARTRLNATQEENKSDSSWSALLQ